MTRIINSAEEDNNRKISEHLQELMERRERLNEAWIETNRHVLFEHNADVVEGFFDRNAAIDTLLNLKPPNIPVLSSACLEKTGLTLTCALSFLR